MVNPFWYLCSTWLYIRARSSTALLRFRLKTESSRISTLTRSGLVSLLKALVTFAAGSSRNFTQLKEVSFKKTVVSVLGNSLFFLFGIQEAEKILTLEY